MQVGTRSALQWLLCKRDFLENEFHVGKTWAGQLLGPLNRWWQSKKDEQALMKDLLQMIYEFRN